MTSFRGEVPLFDALVREEPIHPQARNFVTINYSLGTANDKDFVILVCTVFIQITTVTDGQTDSRTDA